MMNDDFPRTSSYPVSEWNDFHLKTYNIEIVEEFELQPFFKVSELPFPQIDELEEVLAAETEEETHSDGAFQFLSKLLYATHGATSTKAAVDDFAIELFKMLHYTGRAHERVTARRVELPLTVCGRQVAATLPVCLVDAEGLVILIHDSYRHDLFKSSEEAPLVSYAIAAFQYNHQIRSLQGKEVLENQTIAGIKMDGTLPCFYKIPVTGNLTRAVRDGYYPVTKTSVPMYRGNPIGPSTHLQEGMQPLETRRYVLSCYEAFRCCVQSPAAN